MIEDNKVWLVNIPHAGGSTAVFKRWNKKINCNVLNIEYPGHWTRMNEPMVASFSQLSDDVINVIESKITTRSKLIIFGHSIGAIMAWFIAPRLELKGYSVSYLLLSGSQNPGAFPEKSILISATDSDMLRLIGYKVEEHEPSINEQFMKTFLPILKNDMMVCKSFRCDGHYVDVPSTVLYGTEDIFTDISEMKKWSKYVKLVEMKKYPGEHLFIEEKDNVTHITEYINKIILSIG